ncbi:hypothetical protein K1T71_009030 [Dendrolimus kikuchii]|uniref:Uncharacterized protein n=1 Tax=Dendrolimus kikuchii TaxID=765133 RepID=A0ACC1CW96_9NEOP|nr:hypothetical protein K1T71_009030 [Dendrolimus kikuchii]
MKFAIPEISWHNRDPVLSVDFQPKAELNEPLRLATGGTDSHVLIWYISTTDTGSVNLEVAADLTRHQKAVNVVRWSPDGHYLASGDDESIIFVWKQKNEEPAPVMEGEEQYKETWVIYKTLRGHMEDVLDITWSADSLHLASGSVDNKLLLWDLAKGRHTCILSDHKGFVQGVSWDPKGQMIATASTDRVFRTFDISTRKVISRSSKATLPFSTEHPLHNVKVRLQFSPDGLLVAVPAGKVEVEQGKVDFKPINAVYIYTRYSLKVPACILPCGEPALVTRWSPCTYCLRSEGPRPAFPLQKRMVLAVATKRSVLIYDTQQKTPVALISNIHYTRLTDLTWSPGGRTLVASSTDGFCSVITFAEGELGEILPDEKPQPPNAPEPMDVTEDPIEPTQPQPKQDDLKPAITTIDSFFKPPSDSSQKKSKNDPQQKTPVKLDVLEEVAMPSWSDNSNNEIMKLKDNDSSQDIIVLDDSEDIKLVYDESETMKNDSPNMKLDNIEDKQSPKDNMSKSPNNKSVKAKVNTKSTVQNVSKKSENIMTAFTKQAMSKSIPEITGNDKNVSKEESPKESTFMKHAKVADVKMPVTQAAASPKAPRRVSFVTLSSPKNKKK